MDQLNPIMIPYHVTSMDMYAITAFGTDGTRNYPSDDKVRAYMLLTGFQQFDPRLAEMDRVERDVLEGIGGEYRQIENEETTKVQWAQKITGNVSFAGGFVALCLSSNPIGIATMLGGLVFNTVGDPYHDHEKNIGTLYMDTPRINRIRNKVLSLEASINLIGVDTNTSVRQQRQAQRHFNGVVQEYEQNNMNQI